MIRCMGEGRSILHKRSCALRSGPRSSLIAEYGHAQGPKDPQRASLEFARLNGNTLLLGISPERQSFGQSGPERRIAPVCRAAGGMYAGEHPSSGSLC